MNDMQDIFVATVQMPERGVFLLRVDDGMDGCCASRCIVRAQCIVLLDYGEDVGFVGAIERYSPERHGEKVPGFRLLRRVTAQDRQVIAENVRLAEAMRGMFRDAVRNAPDMRIPYARLSFGRKRLFLRYVSERGRPDFSSALDLMRSRYSVDVGIKVMGPRDEVAMLGGLGSCGRVCCCCSWQNRFPSHIAPERRGNLSAAANGVCGRFKCCLAFEREDGCGCCGVSSADQGRCGENGNSSEVEGMT